MKPNDLQTLSPATATHPVGAPPAPRRQLRRSSLLLPLEQRFMFDGAAVVDAAHAAPDAAAKALIPEAPAAVEVRSADPSKDNGKKEVVFVDTSVTNYQTLEASIKAGVEIVEIAGGESGLAQIANWAQSHSGYDAIHILSHGSEALLHLGTDSITIDSMTNAVTQAELAEIGHSLKTGGDLLIYGCDVGQGADGQAWINQLAQATGADVAVSTDATGAQAQGGNWILEKQNGQIDTASPFDSAAIATYDGLLTSFGFDWPCSGSGSKTVTCTVDSETLQIVSASANLTVDSATNFFYSSVTGTSGDVLFAAATDIYGNITGYESQITLTVSGGKLFDLSSFTVVDMAVEGRDLVITTDKGTLTLPQNYLPGGGQYYWPVSLSDPICQGITYATITSSTGQFAWVFDNFVVNNIQAVTGTSITADTGSSATDFVTNTATQTISGTLSSNLQAGETIKVSVDGGSTWTNASASVGTNTWSLSGQTLLAGSNTLKVKITNSAGHDGTIYSQAYTLDSTAPTTTIASASLSADSGSSSTDFITQTGAQTVSGTLSANLASGETVKVSLDGGSTWTNASTTVGANTWSLSGQTLVAGSNTLMVKVVDTAGNDGSVYSHAYTLDTTAPTTTIASAGLSADTGVSSSDFITKTATQSISGTLSANLSVGETVYISLDNGSTWTTASASVGSSTWGLFVPALSGANTLQIKVTDVAGNDGTVYSHTYSVDSTAPTTTVATAAFSADTGTSGTDFITNTAAQTVSGTLSANLVSGEIVYVSLDNGSTWTLATSSVGSNAWSLAGQTLSSSNTLKVRVSDMAGNDGSVYAQAYTLDTTAPTTTVATVSFSADSGTSGTDFITNTAAQTISGTLSANLAAGETVYVSLDNGSTWTAATGSVGSSTWSLAGQTLSASNTLKVKVSDTAGNDGSVHSQAYVLDSTGPAITFSALSLSADTGSSATDFITNTATQTISATLSAAPAGTDIVYGSLDNGATWTNITNKVSGTTLTWNGVTLAGSNTLKLKVTDAAGNDGTVKSQSYTLDSTAPGAPSAPDLSAGSDVGISNSDDLTNVTTPTITGTAEAGATVTLYDTNGSTVLGSGTADGSGNWSITSSTLSAGAHTLTAKATDVAGNTSGASSGLTITVETTAPTGLGVSTTLINSSFATSGATIATLSASDAQAITYSLATGSAGNDADNGRFSVSGTALNVGGTALTAGTYHIYVAATDTAGNATYQALTLTVVDGPSVTSIVRTGGASATVDTTATTITYTVTFDQAVTGVDTTDFTVTGTGTASGSVASVSGSGTTWTVTVNSLGGDGTLRLDLNGSGTGIQNTGSAAILGGYTSGATYTLDHTAPGAPAAPDMTLGSDTGTSGTDNITNNTTPTFTGTAEPNSAVTLYDTDGSTVLGTTTADGAGAWTITTSALSAGSHTLTAKATDAAGNTSVASSGLSVTVDTTAPVAPSAPDLTAGTDTGSSGTDNLTANTTPTFSGTAEANSIVTLYDTDGATVLGTATADGSGAWTITASTLSAGSHTLTAKATDAAGNTSVASSGLSITIDTTAPVVASVSVPANGSYQAGQTLSFTVNTDEVVIVDSGSGTPRLSIDIGGTTVYATYASGSGSTALVFTYTVQAGDTDTNGIAVGALQNNGGSLQDVAGNNLTLTLNSVASTAAVLIDTTAPGAPSAPDLTAGTDSGTSSTDNVTNITTPTFTGTAEANSTVKLYDSNGTTLLGTTTADGAGNWTITSSTLAAGSHTLTVKATDAAGNTSVASAGLAVTIDTTAPAAPSAPDLTVGTDSGNSSTDNLTSNTTPTFSGTAEANSTVILYDTDGSTVLGTATADGSGNWTITASTLATGSHTLTAKATDAAGNTSVSSAGLAVTIDTSAPVAPSAPDLTAATDTGSSSTDDQTKNTTPTFTGSAEANSTVTLYDTDGTTVLGTATADGSGNWSITSSALAAGSHTLTTKATDAAGNTSEVSAGLVVNVDSTASTVGFSNLAFSNDTGSSAADFITRTASQTLTATLSAAPAGTDVVYGSLDGGATWTDITSKVAGTTLTWNGITLAGSNTLMLKVTDAAGNDSTVRSQTYALDTTPPVVTVDAVTSLSTTPVLTGTANEGTFIVTVGGASYIVVAEGGVWRLDLATTTPSSGHLSLAFGESYEVRITATDAAGNSSAATGQVTVVAVPTNNIQTAPVMESPNNGPTVSPAPSVTPPGPTPLPFLSTVTESFLGKTLDSGSQLPVAHFGANGVDRMIAAPGPTILHGMADQQISAVGVSEISVPADLFAHTDPDAVMDLSARQANGRPLPNWITFDPRTGKFILRVPNGVAGELAIRLMARDSSGREVSTIFKLRVGSERAALAPTGRLGLSEQIRLADRLPGNALERLAKAVAMPGVSV